MICTVFITTFNTKAEQPLRHCFVVEAFPCVLLYCRSDPSSINSAKRIKTPQTSSGFFPVPWIHSTTNISFQKLANWFPVWINLSLIVQECSQVLFFVRIWKLMAGRWNVMRIMLYSHWPITHTASSWCALQTHKFFSRNAFNLHSLPVFFQIIYPFFV